MNSVKGIYHDGIVEPIMKPKIDAPTEVIIIFPDETKGITKITRIISLFLNICVNSFRNNVSNTLIVIQV